MDKTVASTLDILHRQNCYIHFSHAPQTKLEKPTIKVLCNLLKNILLLDDLVLILVLASSLTIMTQHCRDDKKNEISKNIFIFIILYPYDMLMQCHSKHQKRYLPP